MYATKAQLPAMAGRRNEAEDDDECNGDTKEPDSISASSWVNASDIAFVIACFLLEVFEGIALMREWMYEGR
jgi:hypothetical protein